MTEKPLSDDEIRYIRNLIKSQKQQEELELYLDSIRVDEP